ncbi:MAG TPA: PP0621 family protein [Noviherbaspirillum sp.]
MKLLFWLMIVFAAIWLLRSKKNLAGGTGPARPAAGKSIETMVQCTHCGVYVPASESIVAVSGAAYCSEEHRLRHAS